MADAPPVPTLPARSAVRTAVAAVGICGQLALALAGVLPVVIVLTTSANLMFAARSGAFSVGRRRRALLVIVVVFGLYCAGHTFNWLVASHEANTSLVGLRDVLGPILIALQLVHAMSWRTRRDLHLGLLVAIGLLVIGASYAPDLVVGLPLLAGWVAALVAVVLLVQTRTIEGVQVVAPGGPGLRLMVLSAVVPAVAFGLIAFLLIPLPKQVTLHAGVGGAGGSSGSSGSSDSTPASGRATALSSDHLDTSARGSLSDAPVAEVPGDSPVLWRSQTFSAWDGRTWTQPASRPRRVVGPPYVLGDTGGGDVRTDQVEVLNRDGTLWSPGADVRQVEINGPLAVNVDGALQTRPGVDSYTVSTSVPATRGEALRSAALQSVDPGYLQLPAELPARVGDLARQITAGAATPYDKVTAIETWLGAHAAYRLDSPVPQDGEDAVDQFLFVDKVGFCEQFAAAETVLLRTVGVPARLVTGLAYGTDVGGGRRSYRQNNLHAWVEVPYAGVGWVASDPTAGASQAAAKGLSPRQHLAAWLRSALKATESFPGGRPGLAALLLVLTVAVAFAYRRLRDRPVPAVTAGVVPPAVPYDARARPALAAFLRLDRRLGPAARGRNESLAEMRLRLAREEALAAAFDVVEQECYAPTAPPADAAVAALEAYAPVQHR